MISIKIVGVKEIKKEDNTFFLLHAISEKGLPKMEGLAVYSAFVRLEHLQKYNVEPCDLLGRTAYYYSVKEGNTFKSGITLKNI